MILPAWAENRAEARLGAWVGAAADLPALPGAYAVWIERMTPAPLPPRFLSERAGSLPPGAYLYLGSARGGGGIRARCARHLAAEKRLRWHVDWVTTGDCRKAVLAVPGGDECALVRAALATGAAQAAVPGFGSSDCRDCPSHLLALEAGAEAFGAIDAALRGLCP